MMQLVLHYDGTGFSGWQRQPDRRTVQGVLEETLTRLFAEPTPVLGAGRTDAGVHARGQAAGVRAPARWTPGSLRRALNGTLPADVWVAAVHPMREEFHARYSATGRRYAYQVGTDEASASPFRRRTEWSVIRELDRGALDLAAALLPGAHCFLGFAVRGTAPAADEHLCTIGEAAWRNVPGGLVFEVEANRFLHHMVRFLVGTMMDVALGRRPLEEFAALLEARDNSTVSAPAPPHALFLDQVRYPPDLYLSPA